ncbi:hypothetical protein, partial [Marinobacter flavimaris]
SRLCMSLFLSGFVTFKKRPCGSGGQSILTIYGLLALLLTQETLISGATETGMFTKPQTGTL